MIETTVKFTWHMFDESEEDPLNSQGGTHLTKEVTQNMRTDDIEDHLKIISSSDQKQSVLKIEDAVATDRSVLHFLYLVGPN